MTFGQNRPVQDSFERFLDFARNDKSPAGDNKPIAERSSSRARDVKSEIQNLEIRNLVDPLAAVGNEDWQFFHHELGFTNGANHVYASRGVPLLRHFLTGMAAPTLGVGVASK